MSHSREKITEIIPKKDAMMDLLDKGPQIIILKVLKELKEAVWRKPEWIYMKKKSANKEIGNHKNSRGEKFND